MNESERQGPDSSRLHDFTHEHGYPGDRQSLRLRHVPSQVTKQNYPEFSWSGNPTKKDEEGNSGSQRDIRAVPMPMALKRAVRQVQQMQVPVVSRMDSWKRKNTKTLRKLKDNVTLILSFLTLWNKSLQKIGGNFGGGVQSYFVFLRFLVILNFISFLLIAGFVLIPSVVFSSTRTSPVFNLTENCTMYDPRPQGLVPFYEYLLDTLSGTGFMEYSYLFYGYYNSTVLEDNSYYNISLAYVLTAVFYFTFCFICIVARMGTAARVAVATGGSNVGNYSRIVFTVWNYGCLGDQAAKLQQNNIHYQLQVDLEEEKMKKEAADLTSNQKALLYSLRVLMCFITLGLITAAFFCIYLATDYSQKKSGMVGFQVLILDYLPSIVITAANFMVPMLCDQIARIERYSPGTTVIVALLRAVFLRLVSLGVLLFTLWSQITCEGDTSSEDCKLCQYNYKLYPCWETRIGQEMYKLVLFDLLTNIAVLILVEFPRRIVVDHWSSKVAQWVGRQEFVVPANVLGLVYGQTVVWTGALFCPLLPGINVIKFIILFYCKEVTLFTNCRPAQKTFRSTTSSFFFLVVLLFGWALATLVMIYSMAVIQPSMGCGPFHSFLNMWSVVPVTFSQLPKISQEFLFFIGSQAFSIPLFALSCIVMCYLIALSSVYQKNVNLLRAQLKLEGRDKQFLVKQIAELSRKLHTSHYNAGDIE